MPTPSAYHRVLQERDAALEEVGKLLDDVGFLLDHVYGLEHESGLRLEDDNRKRLEEIFERHRAATEIEATP